IQTALERAHQVFAGDTFGQRGLLESGAELPFQNAVNAADLLLFAELETVADDLLGAVFSVLSRDEIAALDGALLAMAAFALEIKFHALAPALPANRADVSCQFASPNLAFSRQLSAFSSFSYQVRFTAGGRPSSRLTPDHKLRQLTTDR